MKKKKLRERGGDPFMKMGLSKKFKHNISSFFYVTAQNDDFRGNTTCWKIDRDRTQIKVGWCDVY